MPTYKYIAIIPARYASTRFPAKPLALLGGKPIIQHVFERTAIAFDYTYVATDDERIEKAVRSFGGNVIMTGTHHRSGTDRCYEAYQKIVEKHHITDSVVVVNVQGDEPFIDATQLQTIKSIFTEDANTQIATLVKPYPKDATFEAISNPNSPKVIVSKQNEALYFSRSVIPYLRGVEKEEWASHHTYFKHIGLYAYRADILKEITSLPPSLLETSESLEQLRWLDNGYHIKVGQTDVETIGIDTPEDLERAQEYFQKLQ